MAIKKLPSTGDIPRSTGVPESLVPGGEADSAGFPWAGRTFDHHETAFADDDGRTPEALANAVRALREAAGEYREQVDHLTVDNLAARREELLLEISRSRVLVPLLTEAGDFGETPEGKLVEKTQELSIVTVAAPDGRRAMPVFTSVAAMQGWNPDSRPIPVPAPQVAVAAGQEETDLIIVDPGDRDMQFGIRRPELEAVALGEPVRAAWADPEVRDAFLAVAAGHEYIRALALLPGDPTGELIEPETAVHLMLKSGLDRESLSAMLADLQERLVSNDLIASRVDSMRFVPRAQ